MSHIITHNELGLDFGTLLINKSRVHAGSYDKNADSVY